MNTNLAACAAASLLFACTTNDPAGERVIRPLPVGATQSVPINEVDDAAFWIHPTDPAKSLLLAANERRGLEVHDCDGALLKNVDDGLRPNAVDVAYGIETPSGAVDLAIASCLSAATPGVKVWRVDAERGKLVDATQGVVLPVLGGTVPLGLCATADRATGRGSFFVTSGAGVVEQHELVAGSDGRYSSRVVGTRSFGAKVEGCVVDRDHGVVYFAEEDRGVWVVPLDARDATPPRLVIRVGEHGLVADVEGLALYETRGAAGYLLVVSQGEYRSGAAGSGPRIHVYDRTGANDHLLAIDPAAGELGTLQRTSGLAVTNRATSARFSRGMLAVNDHDNPNGSEDLKLYDWASIAELGGLAIDTSVDPRAR